MEMASELENPSPALRKVDKLERHRNALVSEIRRLGVSNISRTTLTLSWLDNSNCEFGVELYRVDPVEARRNRANRGAS